MFGRALRVARLPLRVTGEAVQLVRELRAVPAMMREMAAAVAALPELERQFARIARDTAVLARDTAALARMEDAVAELSAAMPELTAAIVRLERAGGTIVNGAVPDPELANAATRVAQIAERFPRVRARRRRFA